MEGHALSSQAPGTPLHALMDDSCDVYHEGWHQGVDSLFSIVVGKAFFRCLPRECNMPRVVDDTEVPRVMWVKYATSVDCKTFQIAASAVMDNWWSCLNCVRCFPWTWCVCVCVDKCAVGTNVIHE